MCLVPKLLLLVSATLAGAWAEANSSRDTLIIGQEASRAFLERFYGKMTHLKVKNLQPKEHYLSMHWPDDDEAHKVITTRFDAAHRQFLEMYKPALKNDSVEITIRRMEGNKKLLVLFPMPHISIYLHTVFLNKLSESFSDFDILLVNANPGAIGEKNLSLKKFKEDLNVSFELLRNEGLFSNRKLYLHVICYATLYLEDFLSRNRHTFARMSFYAPMIENKVPNFQFSPNDMVSKSEKYRYSDMHFQLSMVVMDQPLPIVLPANENILNKGLVSEAFAVYERGFDRSGLREASVLLAEEDLIVPHPNSDPEAFQSTYTVSGSNHITPFYVENIMDEYMKILRRSFED